MKLIQGNSLEKLKEIDDSSIHSIITDPPYEIGFAGCKWDSSGIAYNIELWKECLRVLKPGGYLLAFSSARTYHRMAVAIEDSGFEIRDQIMWNYATGFPKGINCGFAIDKHLGQESNVTEKKHIKAGNRKILRLNADYDKKEPSTEECKKWEGWNSTLKPAHEPICVARKPIKSNIAENILEHGTGAFNIKDCKIGNENLKAVKGGQAKIGTFERSSTMITPERNGRYPTNFIHDGSTEILSCFPDNKDIAKFFYCPKPSAKEKGECNNHMTVKPIELMRYLCRLVTPPNGIVLDPFMGSGSTGKAAVMENFSFIGIELSPEFFEIASKRIEETKSEKTIEQFFE